MCFWFPHLLFKPVYWPTWVPFLSPGLGAYCLHLGYYTCYLTNRPPPSPLWCGKFWPLQALPKQHPIRYLKYPYFNFWGSYPQSVTNYIHFTIWSYVKSTKKTRVLVFVNKLDGIHHKLWKCLARGVDPFFAAFLIILSSCSSFFAAFCSAQPKGERWTLKLVYTTTHHHHTLLGHFQKAQEGEICGLTE